MPPHEPLVMTTFIDFPTAESTDKDEAEDSFEYPPPNAKELADSSQANAAAYSSSAALKKSRRSTAFYPNTNSSNKLQKPFSRSAAKRESVMALGSIEHLQHYFTKTGIAAKKDKFKENRGLVPAIGGPANRPLNPSLGSIQEFHLPPSPAAPAFKKMLFAPVDKRDVDHENLKPIVIRDLESVSEAWGLHSSSGAPDSMDAKVDVLHSLRATTLLVRSVRNYCVSLPDFANTPEPEKPMFRPNNLQPAPVRRVVSNSNPASDPQARIRRSAVDVLTVLRMIEETTRLPLSDEAYDAQSDHLSSQDSRSPEPIHSVLDDDDHKSPSNRIPGHDVSFAVSVVSVPGRSEAVPVWDDDDDVFSVADAGDKRELWDERLVVGGGWLYRQDIKLGDLSRERDVIEKYVDAVDELLFEGSSSDGLRGWERAARAERESKMQKGRKSSMGLGRSRSRDVSPAGTDRAVSPNMIEAISGMSITEEPEPVELSETESLDDDELPDWAKRTMFVNDPLARAHALIFALLPSQLQPLFLKQFTSRTDLLSTLCSGQLLCIAYNAAIRRSKRMWGYINKDAIHDIAALESRIEDADNESAEKAEKRKTGWTFRRIDNLRLWAAALKLRYLIPLTTPAQPTMSSLPSFQSAFTSSTLNSPNPNGGSPLLESPGSITSPISPRLGPQRRSPSPARARLVAGAGDLPTIEFDAKIVARREAGWEDMLEPVLHCWVRAVVAEKRGSA